MSDLKHDVTAERWAVLIKERMESGMTVREWQEYQRVPVLLLAENTPPGCSEREGTPTAGIAFCGTSGRHLPGTGL